MSGRETDDLMMASSPLSKRIAYVVGLLSLVFLDVALFCSLGNSGQIAFWFVTVNFILLPAYSLVGELFVYTLF